MLVLQPPLTTAPPPRAVHAGGASQCTFARRNLGGQESAFVLVLQLPLRGVLKSGGLVFVLKGVANQTDRWGWAACLLLCLHHSMRSQCKPAVGRGAAQGGAI